MNIERLRLAVHLHFTLDMEEDHAGCPFSDPDSALEAEGKVPYARANWNTFVAMMADLGEPVPDDFHWNDHVELLSD